MRYIWIFMFATILNGFAEENAIFNVTKYGAKGDSKTLNTKAIQSAIDACASHGGGTVLVPPGTYVSGAIQLKSNVTFHLSPGATLFASPNIADFPPAPFHHNEMGKCLSFIWAIGESNIRITGGGVVDFNHKAFIDFDTYDMDKGITLDVPLSEEQRQESPAIHNKKIRLTQPVFFGNCQGVRFDNVKFQNSPCWTLTLSTCKEVYVNQVTISNGLRVPNADGIHLTGSKEVVIADSIISCADDCIAITGITDWNAISENITISNCVMTSRSAAIRVGHQASKVRNVTVSNIVVRDTNRGIGIFADKGGWVENVLIQNMVIYSHIFAGRWWGKGEPLVVSAFDSGTIRGVSVNDIRAESEAGVLIVGNKNSVKDIQLNNWTLGLKYGKNRAIYKPVFERLPAPMIPAPDPKAHIPWLYASEAQDIRISNVRLSRIGEGAQFKMDAMTKEVPGFEVSNVK